MHSFQPVLRILAIGALAASLSHGALAAEVSTTDQGIEYVSGGVGESEQSDMQAQKDRYSFWLVTATKGSGAYLSDVQVSIMDARSKKPVLEHVMEGPWMFVALRPGRYTVETRYSEGAGSKEQIAKKTITIAKAKHPQKLVEYFKSAD